MNLSSLYQQLRANWRALLVVHIVFALMGMAILAPLFGLLLQGLVAMSGAPAVVDQDIAWLLLSPPGMAAAIFLVAIFLAIAALELGAMQILAQAAQNQRHVHPINAARYALNHALPLLRLTLGLTIRVLAYLLPYLAIVAVVSWSQLSQYDINFYLAERPPEFLRVVTIAAILALPLIWLLGRRLLGWSLALPLMLFGGRRASEVFAHSETLVDGNRMLCLKALLRWLLLAALLTTLPWLLLEFGMALVLGSGSTELSYLALMLGLLTVLWSGLSFLVTALNLAGFTIVTAGLYEKLSPKSTDSGVLDELTSPREEKQAWRGRHIAFVTAVLGLVAAGIWLLDIDELTAGDQVLIIAHRGAAGAAPENTLASIHQAIADKTDWVEIDVQETRDGEVVVVHDSDFMKLAGDPIKVWEGDLERLQQIDVGSWFDPRFSNERIPTLEQVLQVIKSGGGRLVIELKYYGHDQQLEQRVVDLVEASDMSQSVAIMSLKLKGVQKLKALRPGWTGGLLAATAIGDITRLDTDFLAVNQSMASAAFIRRAHKAEKQVFVWTVNDALSLSNWMSRGVDGIITDEPALARSILEQRAALKPAERLLLGATMFFGKPEALKEYRDNSP